MSEPAARPSTVSAGARWIGPYEVFERLGAGGMGEVYRARDSRLGREVALKILPADRDPGSERARRFAQEARSASALNHPNIVTVYEIGADESVAYIAMERVSGRTLRELFAGGPLPIEQLLDLATQVARGLARAHQAGLAHRDLKPENLMLSEDGVVKIVDFGLAKWLAFESGASAAEATETVQTDAGAVLGTVGYMSPEQASGAALDHRSDQFSFGAILYEMATGRRAFERATKPETLAAIIREQPLSIAVIDPRLPAPLCWIVERCLAKAPGERYAATDDLARDLVDLQRRLPRLEPRPAESKEQWRGRRSLAAWAAAILVVLGWAAAGFWLGRDLERAARPLPSWQRVTFRHEGIATARFAPNGDTVIYAAAREGAPQSLYTARLGSPEVRPLGVERASILSISSSADLALLLERSYGRLLRPPHGVLAAERDPQLLYGTLARLPLAGGAPREVLDDVRDADWGPSGDLAVVHFVAGNDQLEYPIGNVLYRSSTWLFHPRVSAAGDRVAFVASDTLLLVARAGGEAHRLADQVSEIAWSPTRQEIWYSRISPQTTEIHAVTLAGKDRVIASLPGDFVLEDFGRDGRLLLGQVFESTEILGLFPSESRERDLSWLDQSSAVAASRDGRLLMFRDRGSSIDATSAIYLRPIDRGSATPLGEGLAAALSPDGRWALMLTPPKLVPTGPGAARPLRFDPVVPRNRGDFFPDGERIFFMGQEEGHGIRGYVAALSGGAPRAVTPEDTRRGLLSGDGSFVTAKAADGAWHLYPTTGGDGDRLVQGLRTGEEPIQWSTDGKRLYVRGPDEPAPGELKLTTRIYVLDPWSGERELWRELPVLNPSSGGEIGRILIADQGRLCIYNHHRYSTDLFVIDGWH